MTEPASPAAARPGPPDAPFRLGRWLRQGGWRALGGAALGAAILATYSHFIGCRTGACMLTADVYTASVVGGLVGLVIGWPASAGEAGAPLQRPR